MYAELKVVERVEEFSCAAAGVVGVGRATAFTLQHMLSVHSLTLEQHRGNICNSHDTFEISFWKFHSLIIYCI